MIKHVSVFTLKDKGAFLPGVLSRKKQVVPPITNAITA